LNGGDGGKDDTVHMRKGHLRRDGIRNGITSRDVQKTWAWLAKKMLRAGRQSERRGAQKPPVRFGGEPIHTGKGKEATMKRKWPGTIQKEERRESKNGKLREGPRGQCWQERLKRILKRRKRALRISNEGLLSVFPNEADWRKREKETVTSQGGGAEISHRSMHIKAGKHAALDFFRNVTTREKNCLSNLDV